MIGRLARYVCLAAGALSPAAPALCAKEPAPLQVAPSVDLARYAGKWYEIARLPNWFQRACSAGTTATYTLRPDGKVGVVNTCRKSDGTLKVAKGIARLEGDREPNTKLKVTFFWPFSGKYWILDLAPDYSWALVGEPSRKYLWVLSREPRMQETVYEDILRRAAARGFDTSRMIRASQEPPAPAVSDPS